MSGAAAGPPVTRSLRHVSTDLSRALLALAAGLAWRGTACLPDIAEEPVPAPAVIWPAAPARQPGLHSCPGAREPNESSGQRHRCVLRGSGTQAG